jgi:hypothetical protein
MQAALLWVVMVIGPDFVIEPRWGPLQFPERGQCEQWLAETLGSGLVKLRSDVRAECQLLGSSHPDFEE